MPTAECTCTGRCSLSALAHQKTENVVLKSSVLLLAGDAAAHKALVHILGLLARGIAEFCRAEIRHFKLHGDAALFLIVFEHAADERQISGEIRRQLFHVFLLHPAMQHFLLQRDIDFLVPIAGALALIIKGPHEGIGEEDPGKALGIEIVRHHRPVGDALLDIQLVENIGEVGVALRLLQLGFLLHQPFRVLRREVIIRIAKQRLGGGDQFGIGVTRSQGRAARRRSHGIHIGIVRKPGMSVMIEDGNLFDLRQQALVNLRHIRPRKRPGLRGGDRRQTAKREHDQHAQSDFHEFS